MRIRNLLIGVALAMLLSLPALAKDNAADPMGGGFTGPSIAVSSVAQALEMSDEEPVRLTGKITQHLGGEKYTFADQSGSITVEIDPKIWQGRKVAPDDIVEINGEIDRDFNARKVDVNSLVIVK